jgi:hypothetical protein
MGRLRANIIEIPEDEQTIQGGITKALEGDTVLVHEGIYFELIDFMGKDITVASKYLFTTDTTSILQTILDGDSSRTGGGGSVVSFTGGEDSTAVLCGFTIRNGIGSYVENDGYAGGGVYVYYSSPKIIANIIRDNTADAVPIGGSIGEGGGIYLEGGSPEIVNNLIVNNKAWASRTGRSIGAGGGLYIKRCIQALVGGNTVAYNESGYTGSAMLISDSRVTISDNNICYNKYTTTVNCYTDQYSYLISIINNRIISNDSYGIGIVEGYAEINNNIVAFNRRGYGIGGDGYIIIHNNTIVSNGFYEDESYGGISLSGIGDISNNIIVSNNGYGIKSYYPSPSTYIDYNDVWDNTLGQYYNYEAGPRDISYDPKFTDLDEFHLSASSPCIDAGDPSADIPEGGGDRIDIGAYEYQQDHNGFLSFMGTPQIGETGKKISWDYSITNPLEQPQRIDAWIEVSGPLCGVVRKFLDIPIPAGETAGTVEVPIPDLAPLGFYTVKGRLGMFREEIWDSEVFDLQVIQGPRKSYMLR